MYSILLLENKGVVFGCECGGGAIGCVGDGYGGTQKGDCKTLDFTENHRAIVTIGIKPNRPETRYGYV